MNLSPNSFVLLLIRLELTLLYQLFTSTCVICSENDLAIRAEARTHLSVKFRDGKSDAEKPCAYILAILSTMKLATLPFNFARSSLRKYIMWPAS